MDGINAGKYDEHLNKFTFKDYYTHEEWKKLHPMIRRKKFLAKKSRGGGGRKRGDAGERRGKKRTVAELKAQIKELRKQKKELEAEENSTSDEEDEAQGTNDGNPALEPHGGTRNGFKKNKGRG